VGCSKYLIEHEHSLMASISALPSSRLGLAQAEMILLCEGHDTSAALSAFTELIIILPQLEQIAPSEA
jgi:hypothetical protein|tara:strand:- start:89 stop:292 length:204 start_codon:yes stop_codon:yes gene_type:complete